MDVEGRFAVVTGGASGIGAGVCRTLAGAGMGVLVADIDGAAAEELAGELRESGAEARAAAVDVSDPDASEELAEEAFRRFGNVHVLHNNAGVICAGPAAETSGAEWDRVLSVNLLGVVNGCRAFVPRLLEQEGGGHIVNTASIGGFLAAPTLAVYCASKFAVVGFSETLRLELAPRGIGVSILAPGGVKTNLIEAERGRPGGGIDASFDLMRKALDEGMDPLQVGKCVLRGIRAGAPYIFTHPEFREAFEGYFQRVLAGFEESSDP